VKGNGISMAPRLRIRLLPSLLALALVACAPAASTPSSSSLASVSPSSAPSAAPHTVYPLSVTDDAGRQVTIPAAPTRIVSLAPSNTEIVWCLRRPGSQRLDDYLAGEERDTSLWALWMSVVVAAQPSSSRCQQQ
jgi:ABC-type Fe3+-hydroxamate transport system substrate-binding protein